MNPYVGGDYKALFGPGKPFDPIDKYFAEPTLNQAKQKDAYMLISAGPDGIYGTKDDVTNFGL
jgi:hypothetical protein